MPQDRPNILLIFADELRADALGCFGNAICRTPSIDALAEEGTLFTQCMVTQPTCTPCRASLLTGCYPSALRSRMVGCHTPDDERFLPRLLAADGYRTASIGKLHLVPQGREAEAIQATRRTDGKYDYYGFREINLVNDHGHRCMGPEYDKWLRTRVPDADRLLQEARPYERGVGRTVRYPLPEHVHSSNYIGDRTVEFLREAGDQPFFLHVSFNDPHHPFTAPEPWESMYDPEDMPPPIRPVTESMDPLPLQLKAFRGESASVGPEGRPVDRVIGTPPIDYSRHSLRDWQQVKALYYAMTSLLDHNVGRILEALRETGLVDNTQVWFVSDHGDYLGDHGLLGKGFHYDSVIRTPLIVRGPGVQLGRRLDSVSSVVDVAPTMLEACGVSEPEGIQGRSMLQVLRGEMPPFRTTALTENDDDFAPFKARTLTTDRWKLTRYVGLDGGELYDRRNDPEEVVNLWDREEHAATKHRLLDMLLEEVICAGDVANGRVQSPAVFPPKWVPRHNQPDPSSTLKE